MRAEMGWQVMRFALWLSRVAPCPFTERFRSARVGRCMRATWL